jgi:hypothetical protein
MTTPTEIIQQIRDSLAHAPHVTGYGPGMVRRVTGEHAGYVTLWACGTCAARVSARGFGAWRNWITDRLRGAQCIGCGTWAD